MLLIFLNATKTQLVMICLCSYNYFLFLRYSLPERNKTRSISCWRRKKNRNAPLTVTVYFYYRWLYFYFIVEAFPPLSGIIASRIVWHDTKKKRKDNTGRRLRAICDYMVVPTPSSLRGSYTLTWLQWGMMMTMVMTIGRNWRQHESQKWVGIRSKN